MVISFKPKPVSKQDAELVMPDRIQTWINEFDKAGLQYGLSDKDEHEIKFEHRVRQRPDTLTVRVGKVVRVRNPDNGDEFMYYTCEKTVLDNNDNEVKYNNVYGIHPIPVTTKKRDENDYVAPVDFSHFKIAYDIPWSELEFDRLVKASNGNIRNLVVAQTSEVWNQRYSGIPYHIHSRDNFRNLSWEELVKMAAVGEEELGPKKKKTRSDKGVSKSKDPRVNKQLNRGGRQRPVETKAAEL